ncbi:transcription factor bHLH95 [Trifolium repens]|nr:transcription factor bHLH95 [Trifolium repens]
MVMSVDHDQGVQSDFIWENPPWFDLTNSDNLGESSKQKLDMKSMNLDVEINEGEALANKKRKRGGAVARSESNTTIGEGKDGKNRNFDHEMHILTERERRKKMRNMFASLHALLPQLPSKADKSTIVDEAVKQIKNLQQILQNLEKKKQEKLKSVSPFGTESSSVINNTQWHPYESREAILTDQGSSSYNNNLATSAIVTSNALSISAPPPQLVAFQTWSSQNVVLNICGEEAQFCICATKKPGLLTTIAFVFEKHRIDIVSANISCNGNGNFYMIMAHAKQGSYQDANSLEETYKQAASEIMMWIS